MFKAAREAKVHTSWLTPNQQYEDALKASSSASSPATAAGDSCRPCARCSDRIAVIGMMNSLSQVAVKLGSPGVPDVYQGTDLWDLSLVDPDNRRPVDFDRRRGCSTRSTRLLPMPRPSAPTPTAEMLARLARRAHQAAAHRRRPAPAPRRRRSCSSTATICRSRPTSRSPGNAIAFARLHGGDGVLFVAPRLCARLVGGDLRPPLGESWKTSRVLLPPPLAGRSFRHEFTGAEIRPTIAGDQAWLFVGQLFEHVPVGILRVT